MTDRYTYEQKMVRMRWVDFVRIRDAFPPLENERTWEYFRRLALFIQVNKKLIEMKK